MKPINWKFIAATHQTGFDTRSFLLCGIWWKRRSDTSFGSCSAGQYWSWVHWVQCKPHDPAGTWTYKVKCEFGTNVWSSAVMCCEWLFTHPKSTVCKERGSNSFKNKLFTYKLYRYYIYIYIYIYIYMYHIYIYEVHTISLQTFFLWIFKIVLDTWKFTMLLLYILWDDWRIFMISGSNEQLQQQLEYTLLKPDCHSWGISKMQSDSLEERYAINCVLKLKKNATEMYGMLQTAFQPSCINRASVFEWHKRFREGREFVRDDKRCGRGKEVNTPKLIGQRLRLRVKGYYFEVLREFRKRFLGKRSALFKSGQWHFHQDNAPVNNSILVTDYLTKMGIKTVPHPPYSPYLSPSDFWLFPKLIGCRYETIEETKEAVTKVIDTLTQEGFLGAFNKLLERYNKSITSGGDYFEGD